VTVGHDLAQHVEEIGLVDVKGPNGTGLDANGPEAGAEGAGHAHAVGVFEEPPEQRSRQVDEGYLRAALGTVDLSREPRSAGTPDLGDVAGMRTEHGMGRSGVEADPRRGEGRLRHREVDGTITMIRRKEHRGEGRSPVEGRRPRAVEDRFGPSRRPGGEVDVEREAAAAPPVGKRAGQREAGQHV